MNFKREKMKKRLKIVSLFMLPLLLSNCANDNTTADKSILVGEPEINSGSITHINENNIVMLSLEHSHSDSNSSNDLATKGSDCFLFKLTKDLNSVLIDIDDANISLIKKVTIEDINSSSVTTILSEEKSQTFNFLKDKEYKYCIEHDESKAEDSVLFVRFDTNSTDNDMIGSNELPNITKLKSTKACVGCDFSGINFLSDKININSFRGLNLSEAKLNNAKVPKELDNANLSKADMTGVNLYGDYSLIGSNLDGAILNLNRFRPSHISNASFKGTNLKSSSPDGLYLGYFSEGINSVDFSEADLTKVRFPQMTFKSCTFNNAVLTGASFANATLDGSSLLSGADFSSANFSYAVVDKAQFLGTILESADFSEASVQNTNFQGSYIKNTIFPNDTDLSGTLLIDPYFIKPSYQKCIDNGGKYNTNGECVATLEEAKSICTLPSIDNIDALMITSCSAAKEGNISYYSAGLSACLSEKLFLDTSYWVSYEKSVLIQGSNNVDLWSVNSPKNINVNGTSLNEAAVRCVK